MNRKKTILLVLIIIIPILILSTYRVSLSPVEDLGDVRIFTINSGSTIRSIIEDLEREGLIRSGLAFKLYVKVNNVDNFQTGSYELSTSMSVPEIAAKFQMGDVVFPEGTNVTFPEGTTIDEIAEILSFKINYSKEEILSRWNDPEFVDKAITNFTMLTEEIKSSAIEYPLNGYFFPATYFLKNDDVSPEEVGWMMMKKMEEVLYNYQEDIAENELSVHEILTLASIIEYEAKDDEDRPIISGVFYNRLEKNMKLQSCATLNMALGVHKQVYTQTDMKVDSPYNTYVVQGLPVGPGNCPGEKSIEAAINPAKHDYLYFLSDIYGNSETYYSTTLEEHNRLKDKYLK